MAVESSVFVAAMIDNIPLKGRPDVLIAVARSAVSNPRSEPLVGRESVVSLDPSEGSGD